MRNKIIAILMLLALLNVSLVFAVVAAQPSEQTKGGLNVQAFEASRGKPTKPAAGGITNGTISISTGNKYAIIIGINNYAGSSSDLQYCVNDASEFKAALIDDGWSTNQITYLTDTAATRKAIMDAVATVATEANVNDEVVFFYSGHGSISTYDIDNDGERKDECIIPVQLSSSYWIWDGELQDAFANCKSKRMMFYFDSCYSGGMTDLAAPGRLICMACGENQLSLESGSWENGQFSYYFVDLGMKRGNADLNEDGYVTFEEAFDYASANCRRQSPVASDQFEYDMVP